MTYKSVIALLFLIVLFSCQHDPVERPDDPEPSGLPEGTEFIESSPQRTGDVQAGYDYLVNGNYVDAGIPYNFYMATFGENHDNLLNRTGDNAVIDHELTAVDAFNGERVVAVNCLQCHAQKLNGELIVGLGNAVADFTSDQSALVPGLNAVLQVTYGANSPQYQAYQPFGKAIEAVGPHVVTPIKGANTATKLSFALAAHRDINDLSWSDDPQYPIPAETIPSDVPAWWILKKKNAMFYSGGGRGDFARIMMASSVLTLQDSTKAREVDNHFADVLAYINSLEPPPYPEAIDEDLAAQGEVIFTEHCTSCHGYYTAYPTYPNLLVSLDVVGTDPALSNSKNAAVDFLDWYNNSWFAQSPASAQYLPGDGYVAPPLDGIWATAPYLHNGSVPTLLDLLDSSQRPDFWERNFNNTSDYDYEKVGWNYQRRDQPGSSSVYDSTLPGYGNGGHTFGDVLNVEERNQLIEYLKTL